MGGASLRCIADVEFLRFQLTAHLCKRCVMVMSMPDLSARHPPIYPTPPEKINPHVGLPLASLPLPIRQEIAKASLPPEWRAPASGRGRMPHLPGGEWGREIMEKSAGFPWFCERGKGGVVVGEAGGPPALRQEGIELKVNPAGRWPWRGSCGRRGRNRR